MQETRYAVVDGEKIPVLLSDENEALLAAKAAGRAIVGLWRDCLLYTSDAADD